MYSIHNTKFTYILKLTCIFSFFFSFYLIYTLNFITNQIWIYKFIFLHVPYAWSSIFFFFIIIIMSLYSIIYNNNNIVNLIYKYNFVCFYYLTITLFTGMIWGKLTWGTYWEWDIRLLSTFLIWLNSFFFFFYFFWNKHIGLFIMILSSINIPIIKYGIFWFNSLHQYNSINFNSNLIDISCVYILFSYTILNLFYILIVIIFFNFEFYKK